MSFYRNLLPPRAPYIRAGNCKLLIPCRNTDFGYNCVPKDINLYTYTYIMYVYDYTYIMYVYDYSETVFWCIYACVWLRKDSILMCTCIYIYTTVQVYSFIRSGSVYLNPTRPGIFNRRPICSTDNCTHTHTHTHTHPYTHTHTHIHTHTHTHTHKCKYPACARRLAVLL